MAVLDHLVCSLQYVRWLKKPARDLCVNKLWSCACASCSPSPRYQIVLKFLRTRCRRQGPSQFWRNTTSGAGKRIERQLIRFIKVVGCLVTGRSGWGQTPLSFLLPHNHSVITYLTYCNVSITHFGRITPPPPTNPHTCTHTRDVVTKWRLKSGRRTQNYMDQ